FRLESVRTRRYRALIHSRIFPVPERLEFHKVGIGGESEEGILVIEVPTQSEALKPFLVHGAVVGGKAVGTHVAFFERRGADSRAASAAEIHGLLSAGRLLLRQAPDTP